MSPCYTYIPNKIPPRIQAVQTSENLVNLESALIFSVVKPKILSLSK